MSSAIGLLASVLNGLLRYRIIIISSNSTCKSSSSTNAGSSTIGPPLWRRGGITASHEAVAGSILGVNPVFWEIWVASDDV